MPMNRHDSRMCHSILQKDSVKSNVCNLLEIRYTIFVTMKRLFILIIALFLLSACTQDQTALNSSGPRIPKRGPSIPNKAVQANLLGSTAAVARKPKTDIAGLINRIDQDLEGEDITTEDIERGWYYARENEKKWGTPSSWIWEKDGFQSYWISPNALEEVSDIQIDELCRETAGYFVVSCIERELPHCEHIANSVCRCPNETRWIDDQGCILVNELDELVRLGSEDLKNGWYLGLPNQKKLHTPSNWIWVENGRESRWQNASPIR